MDISSDSTNFPSMNLSDEVSHSSLLQCFTDESMNDENLRMEFATPEKDVMLKDFSHTPLKSARRIVNKRLILCENMTSTPRSKSLAPCARSFFAFSQEKESMEQSSFCAPSSPLCGRTKEEGVYESPSKCHKKFSSPQVLTHHSPTPPKKTSSSSSLVRSLSASLIESPAKNNLYSAYECPDLIGDFSTTFLLPVVKNGRHPDIKAISAKTLSQVLTKTLPEVTHKCIERFEVIDARFPYEFSGGHVQNAFNLFTREQIMTHFLHSDIQLPHNRSIKDFLSNSHNSSSHMKYEIADDSQKRNIFVFHCEFSAERGPNLCRFLRDQDRIMNNDRYPRLYYPELYLLEGGYQQFFKLYPELCFPKAYKQMFHSDHLDDLKHFKAKSKSWNGSKILLLNNNNPHQNSPFLSKPSFKKRHVF